MTLEFGLHRWSPEALVFLAVGDDNIRRFERTISEVVDTKKLPIRITINDNQEDRSDLVEKLRGVFTSEQAIAGKLPLMSLY